MKQLGSVEIIRAQHRGNYQGSGDANKTHLNPPILLEVPRILGFLFDWPLFPTADYIFRSSAHYIVFHRKPPGLAELQSLLHGSKRQSELFTYFPLKSFNCLLLSSTSYLMAGRSFLTNKMHHS